MDLEFTTTTEQTMWEMSQGRQSSRQQEAVAALKEAIQEDPNVGHHIH